MIGVMEDIAEYSMSYFDTAKNKGKHAPENFYHGLVLGLVVSMRKEYRIVSNRESGEGRYDIAIYPFDKTKDAYILEFKVLNEHREKTVQETAQNALKQIRTRNYEADLLAYGIPADHIYKLGFGFLGKKVWVVSDPNHSSFSYQKHHHQTCCKPDVYEPSRHFQGIHHRRILYQQRFHPVRTR